MISIGFPPILIVFNFGCVVNKSNCQPAFASGFLKHRYSCGSGTNIVGNPHYEGGHQRPIVVNVQQLEDEDIMAP